MIAGPHVSPGYLGRPDLTEKAFFVLDGMRAYRTGDEGHYQDGLLFFDGRMDNQIKLHGYRIELGDVEANLQALPGVRDAVVLAVIKDGRAESLAAFVILDRGQDPRHASGCPDHCRPCEDGAERCPPRPISPSVNRCGPNWPSACPPTWSRGSSASSRTFPMTANGKADRRKLAETLT